MRIRLSKITLGFAAIGFGLGLVSVALAVIYAAGDEATKDAISGISGFIELFCPPSLALMALDKVSDWSHWAVVFGMIIVINTCLYGLVGAVVSVLIKLTKKQA